MTDLPTISRILTYEIPALSYTWSPKKLVALMGGATRISYYREYTLGTKYDQYRQ